MMRRIHGAMFKLPLMITCEEFEGFILAYLDGELSGRQKSIFEMHLRVCRDCREYLRAYRATMQLTRSAETEAPDLSEQVPDDLVKAVLDARNA